LPAPSPSPARTPRGNVQALFNSPEERALPTLRTSKTAKSVAPAPASAPAQTTGKAKGIDPAELAKLVATQLDEDKAENILEIDLAGKSPMADTMIVASGRSARHVAALADHVVRKLKDAGASKVRMEGMPNADWVLIDAGDVVVHIFRPEVREFYNLERLWTSDAPPVTRAAGLTG
jgi:ribosome-associated protein